jgi:hypothetical protein
MPLLPDAAAFHKSLATLPVSIFEPGEIVLARRRSATGRLLVLRQGGVEVVKDGLAFRRRGFEQKVGGLWFYTRADGFRRLPARLA